LTHPTLQLYNSSILQLTQRTHPTSKQTKFFGTGKKMPDSIAKDFYKYAQGDLLPESRPETTRQGRLQRREIPKECLTGNTQVFEGIKQCELAIRWKYLPNSDIYSS
jgi:hypothetical protein